jgi:Uma2 family endonuclease
MGQPLGRYVVDPDDPRAPPEDVWNAMTAAEREEVLANLPSEFPVSDAAPPEGDPHFDAIVDVRQVLRSHFGRIGRRVYIANDLPVYYPGESMFSPDVIAITDVDTRAREHWTVAAEGKGVEVAMEILWSGRRKKDLRDNVERYARLGIPEYFVFDRRKLRLHGYRLSEPGARTYRPIVPQGGRYASEILGLDLVLEGERLRFLYGLALVPDATELIARLDAMLGDATAKREEAERRAEEEARRAEEEARRAEEEAQRASEAERRLAEALAELSRVKGR